MEEYGIMEYLESNNQMHAGKGRETGNLFGVYNLTDMFFGLCD